MYLVSDHWMMSAYKQDQSTKGGSSGEYKAGLMIPIMSVRCWCNPGINDQLRGCCDQPPLSAAPRRLQMAAQWLNVVVARAAA